MPFRSFLLRCCFVGSHLRIPEELSLFWPVNALIAGLMVRNPFLHQTQYYLTCFTAMFFNDAAFSGWALPAFTLNFANILFILTAVSMLVKHFQHESGSERIANAIRIFPACLLAAFACATWGALAQKGEFNTQLVTAWGDWFSEQFSTGLMLLPFLLTRNWQTMCLRQLLRMGKISPVITVALSLVAGAIMGGAGSLIFPIPALIWLSLIHI